MFILSLFIPPVLNNQLSEKVGVSKSFDKYLLSIKYVLGTGLGAEYRE